jgi:hypothetical protein
MDNNSLITAVRDTIINIRRRNTFDYNNIIVSRYYNNPPQGGYQIDEEHNYILPDNDDVSSIALLEVVTFFGNKENLFFTPQKNLKHLKLKKIKENDILIETVCSICLDNYKKNEFYRVLDCNHTFHKKCIDRWFKKDHLNCPMCRATVK